MSKKNIGHKNSVYISTFYMLTKSFHICIVCKKTKIGVKNGFVRDIYCLLYTSHKKYCFFSQNLACTSRILRYKCEFFCMNPSKYSRQAPRPLRPCVVHTVGSSLRIYRGHSSEQLFGSRFLPALIRERAMVTDLWGLHHTGATCR
jgi:hypothetical protein